MQERPEGLGEGEEHGQRCYEHEARRAVAGPQHPEPLLVSGAFAPRATGPGLGPSVAAVRGRRRRAAGPRPAQAFRTGLKVTGTGLGGHDHTSAHHVRSPRQVEVLAGGAGCGAETTQSPPEVTADKDSTAGCDEHLPGRIVLALVELAWFDQWVDHPEVVRPHAHGQQAVGVVPRNELRAREPGIAAVSLFQQEADGIGR